VLGTLAVGVAPGPATAATPGVVQVADHQAAEKPKGAKHDGKLADKNKKHKKAKKAKARQLRKAKAKTYGLATLRKTDFAVASNDPQLATLPVELATAVRGAAAEGTARIEGWVAVAKQAKMIKRVRKVRALISAERPDQLTTVIWIAHRATVAFSEGDTGLLEGLLKDLAGANLAGTPLEPVTDLVDGLLDAILADSGADVAIDEVLDGLVDVVDQLLGGLLGGLGGTLQLP
jgi:hypothetical protein